jgi:hypothetical protein
LLLISLRPYINSDYNNVPHGVIIVVKKIQSQIQVNSQPREKPTRYSGLYRRNECSSKQLGMILLTPAFPSFLSHRLHDGLLARSLLASLLGWVPTVPCRALLCRTQTRPNPEKQPNRDESTVTMVTPARIGISGRVRVTLVVRDNKYKYMKHCQRFSHLSVNMKLI